MNAAMLVRGTRRPWHWRHLLLAPHRLGFFMGLVVLATSALWWLAVEAQRSGGSPGFAYTVSPSLVHAAVMTFGFIPLFFSGFLFTAGPKWLGVPGPDARQLVPALLAQLGGWLAWLSGSHVHVAIAGAALVLALTGLCRVTSLFWRLICASTLADRMHAKAIGAALLVGCTSLAGLAVSVLAGEDTLARLFVLSGLWGFVVVVYVTAAHRMIPFFTSDTVPLVRAWRPNRVLWLMLGAASFEAVAPWIDTHAAAHPAWQVSRGVIELLAGGMIVRLAVAWGLVQSLKIRLLAMLHLGFLWLGLGLALAGTTQLLGWATGAQLLPLAPLHAITMGALGSLMLAMVTRVSCGHSGRPLVADNLVWGLFWLLQLATLLRIAATVPAWPGQTLLTAAALLWGALTLTWSVRYGSWYGRPRADGRAG